MKKWFISWLADPLVPILVQSYRVLLATESTLNDVLKTASDLGVSADTPIFNSIKTVITAVIAVKVAVSKTVEFLGGVIPPEVQTSTLNLEKELEKLKKIL
jgi:hypothetical protein